MLSIAMCRKGNIKYVQFPDTYAYFNAPFDYFFNHWLIYTCEYMMIIMQTICTPDHG